MKVFIRSPYNYDRRAAALAVGVKCETESRAVQSGKEDANINVIVKRFLKTGVMPQRLSVAALTGFVTPLEYRDAMDRVVEAKERFASLPAVVRKRFENDPAQLLAACQDPSRVAELRELGILEPEPRPPAAPPVPDSAPTGGSAGA